MIEERLSRAVPFLVLAVALLTGGAWLASLHPSYAMPPMQPPNAFPPPPQQPPPPYPQRPPPPRGSDCSSCADCADCDCDVTSCDCDLSGCDLSGCDGCDLSGCDCTLGPSASALRSIGLLTLLLPLAMLDAWRRRLARLEDPAASP